MLIAILPAHNEEAGIAGALDSLHAQNPAPDGVFVVTDNCTDRTAEIATAHGATVLTTIDNTAKKAGALNQALVRLVPCLDDDSRVLIQDADTTLSPDFVSTANEQLAQHDRLGAVGAVFYGGSGGGLLGQFQRNEYLRYSREIYRTRDRVRVLSGTAAMFRVEALADVQHARQAGDIPGGSSYYDPGAWTEDNEMTLAVKSCGWSLLSPAECSVETEIMPTLTRLWHQRIRWQRGALDNLKAYGWTRVTAPYIIRQILMGLSMLALLAFLLFTVLSTVVAARFAVVWPWPIVGMLFAFERAMTVRRGGWRAVLLGALLLPELVYDLFQHTVFATCVVKSAGNTSGRWS